MSYVEHRPSDAVGAPGSFTNLFVAFGPEEGRWDIEVSSGIGTVFVNSCVEFTSSYTSCTLTDVSILSVGSAWRYRARGPFGVHTGGMVAWYGSNVAFIPEFGVFLQW